MPHRGIGNRKGAFLPPECATRVNQFLEPKMEASSSQLRREPVVILLALSLIWGANMALIKIGGREMGSLFMAGTRSLVASLCLMVWIKCKGVPLFPSRAIAGHGVVVGLMFGGEFSLVYVALEYTLASRLYVLVYTAPFFAALGAHFFLQGDRINPWKAAGLVVAFLGVVVLFGQDIGAMSLRTLPGDLMGLGAGALWGATTVYVKRHLAHKGLPLQTLFYQVFFSAPFLLALSAALERPMVSGFSPASAFSLFFQCIIVAFLSYLVWFELIHRYPVSLLHAFSFFTPVFGVFLSGALILGEPIRLSLILALSLVSIGLILVNRTPKPRPLLDRQKD
ncbi:MAG: DMT family transporter [Desulfohalobiaceae bacterium]|nr:DMT family transporter [Desulfohalobiaceae bacterium]